MSTTDTNKPVITEALFVKMALDSWNIYNKRATDLFDSLTDEQLQGETAPGRNTGVYLLGHLTAVHDAMLPLLGLGDKLYPELEEAFLETPDKSGYTFPPVADLRKAWVVVKDKLAEHLANMQPQQWFERHTVVSPGDFAKEPHRNRLNVIINRTNHLSHHYGQLVYLKPKK